MATQKFSAMTAATSVASADLVPIVQGGTNKKATVLMFPQKYTQTVNLTALAETDITTTIATVPYIIQLFDSSGNLLDLLVRTATSGGVYHVYVYSTDALNNVLLHIIY